jgi:hypothetical protein
VGFESQQVLLDQTGNGQVYIYFGYKSTVNANDETTGETSDQDGQSSDQEGSDTTADPTNTDSNTDSEDIIETPEIVEPTQQYDSNMEQSDDVDDNSDEDVVLLPVSGGDYTPNWILVVIISLVFLFGLGLLLISFIIRKLETK